jgi:membrane protein
MKLMILIRCFTDFFRHEGPFLAGSISCFFMLSFVPFSLFLVSIFGYVLGHHPTFYEFFRSQASHLFPQATDQINRELEILIRYREIGLVTLLIYGFFSYQLFSSFEIALAKIFRENPKRSLRSSIFLALFIVTLLFGAVILFFAAAWIFSWLDPSGEVLPWLKGGFLQTFLLRWILPILLVLFISAILYRLLPGRGVKLRHALWGGLFTAAMLEAAKPTFTLYMIGKITRLGAIYGSLTAVVTSLLWLFYASSIFLIGAELVRKLGEEE